MKTVCPNGQICYSTFFDHVPKCKLYVNCGPDDIPCGLEACDVRYVMDSPCWIYNCTGPFTTTTTAAPDTTTSAPEPEFRGTWLEILMVVSFVMNTICWLLFCYRFVKKLCAKQQGEQQRVQEEGQEDQQEEERPILKRRLSAIFPCLKNCVPEANLKEMQDLSTSTDSSTPLIAAASANPQSPQVGESLEVEVDVHESNSSEQQ